MTIMNERVEQGSAAHVMPIQGFASRRNSQRYTASAKRELSTPLRPALQKHTACPYAFAAWCILRSSKLHASQMPGTSAILSFHVLQRPTTGPSQAASTTRPYNLYRRRSARKQFESFWQAALSTILLPFLASIRCLRPCPPFCLQRLLTPSRQNACLQPGIHHLHIMFLRMFVSILFRHAHSFNEELQRRAMI